MAGVEVLHAHFRRHEYPRHTHETTTVALVDSGAATFAYRGRRFTAVAGSSFVINPGEVHTGQPAAEHGYGYRVLYLDPSTLAPLLGDDSGGGEPLRFDGILSRDRRLAGLLDRAHAVLGGDAEPLRQEQAVLAVCRELPRYFDHSPPASLPPDRRAEHRMVALARDYLEAHAADKVLLRDLAARVGSSPFRLVRIFSEQVGMPPHAYQTQVRIRRARRLLAAGVPAETVAGELGFCDQPHLIRTFKKYTGVTPAQFSVGVRPG